MPRPGKTRLSLDITPYNLCVSRCVRRDYLSSRNAAVFAPAICDHSVMSSHGHTALHVNRGIASSWSQNDLIQHWHTLLRGPGSSQRYPRLISIAKAEIGFGAGTRLVWCVRLPRIRAQDVDLRKQQLKSSTTAQAPARGGCPIRSVCAYASAQPDVPREGRRGLLYGTTIHRASQVSTRHQGDRRFNSRRNLE